VVSELGVFGRAMFGEGRGLREEQAGWLVGWLGTIAEDVDVVGVTVGSMCSIRICWQIEVRYDR
jgi:hypothetical protein